MTMDSRFEIRDSRSEIRDPRFESRDSRSEIRDSRFEIRDSRFEIRDSRFEIRDPRFEIRDSRFEIRDSRFEIRNPRSEIRDPRFEIRDSRLETWRFGIRGSRSEQGDLPTFLSLQVVMNKLFSSGGCRYHFRALAPCAHWIQESQGHLAHTLTKLCMELARETCQFSCTCRLS